MSYKILDWAGNQMIPNAMIKAYHAKMTPKRSLTFKSFDDAESFLSEVLGNDYEEDRQEYYIYEV